jgi:hypothetical protein
MTGPYFESWEHDNLVKFAKDAYAKLQKQEEELQRLRSQWPERQEPVAWWNGEYVFPVCLYTTPLQRQPLTEEEIEALARYEDKHGQGPWHLAFARAIERKHGIGGEHD